MRTMVTLSAEKMLSRKSVGLGHCSGFVIASAMLILALTRAPSADAAVLNVTDLGDSDGPGQLRTAIASASLGDLIVVPAGIVKLTRGALVITKTLSIAGMGPTVTVIDGGRADRVFVNCTPATTLTLAGLGIQNGVFNGGRGGGIVNCTGSTLRVSDAAVTENSAAAGGGLSNERGTVSLNRVTISRNAANSGGGVANIGDSSSLVLSDVTLTGNQAARDGGGLFNNVGNLTLTNTLVSGNTAGGDGGGIFHAGIGRVATLSNVTVSGNVATASGGGVLNFAGTVNMTNVTIVDNAAQGSGGAKGGGIATFIGVTSLKNSIVTANQSGGNCFGSVVSLGHNLDSGSTCTLTAPTDLSNTDPLLGPLQDNGGITATHAILPGSRAADAGDNTGCPTSDQRGIGRPQGTACDIGAYEQALGSPAAGLVAAVLPASRSVQVGASASAFASLINVGPGNAVDCALSLSTDVMAAFTYQTTDGATNVPTGTANTPVAIGANETRTFVFAITPTAPFSPTDVAIGFHCRNTTPAPSVSGLNTVLVSAAASPVPDIVALVATDGGRGIVTLSPAGAFAVATVNVGASAEITAVADTGSTSLPVSIAICQTESGTGACLSAPTPSVSVGIGANETRTFGVFVTGDGMISDNAAVNRVFVRFKDPGGTIRGATSVAVRSQ